jgi:hypothetical protein
VTLAVVFAAIAIAIMDRTGARAQFGAKWEARAQHRALTENWTRISQHVTPVCYDGGSGPLIVEAFSYTCPGCVASSEAVRAATGDSTRLALLHLPRKDDSVATRGAALSICAGAFGIGAQMHDYLTTNPSWHELEEVPVLRSAVEQVVADSVEACVRHDRWRSVLVVHRALAQELRIRYTPFLFGKSGATMPGDAGVAELVQRESRAHQANSGILSPAAN